MRAAILSTYPPRLCGIGAFAYDLRSALVEGPIVDDAVVVSMVDGEWGPDPPEVVAKVATAARGDYVRAARIVGREGIDVVLLQHEFGIFGGPAGEHVLSFVGELTAPLVVTLHTVTSTWGTTSGLRRTLRPRSRTQLRVVERLCDRAQLVVVMTQTARQLLVDSGACDPAKIRVVPHGVPGIVVNHDGREPSAGRRVPHRGGGSDLHDRFVFSTFGLISSGKGLEHAIEAFARVVERHPQALYIVAGRTHPRAAKPDGAGYRRALERRVGELGLSDHVLFDNRFLPIEEIADLLAATDVFVTPYRSREQIVSGSLTYAIAAGCAVISTPYWYASEMLATGAGVLVPFNDAPALAGAMCDCIEDDERLAEARRHARSVGAALSWSAVGALTAQVLTEAVDAHSGAGHAPRARRLARMP